MANHNCPNFIIAKFMSCTESIRLKWLDPEYREKQAISTRKNYTANPQVVGPPLMHVVDSACLIACSSFSLQNLPDRQNLKNSVFAAFG